MKTKIITIEGIDGSGKTVQFNKLREGLTARGYSVDTKSFPVYESFFGSQVGRLLSGEEGVLATDVDQKSMALWFALDRFEAFRDWRDGEYDFLIINRYVLSNAVYQSIRDRDHEKPDIIDWVFELEYGHFGLPRPDLNVFFDVNTERAGQNVDRKGFREYVGGECRDVYERSSGIQERASAMYRLASERYEDVCVVNCMDGASMRAPDDIARDVMLLLSERGLIENNE
ncbi:MAG: dTMP kinase [Clostridia bacterium]|nr:dTMP kinase [Clostridia bacterium]